MKTVRWVLLVVIGAAVALTYFGIINPSFLPERCLFQKGFECKEFIATAKGVQLKLENTFDKDVVVTGINISQAGCVNENLNVNLGQGMEYVFNIKCNLTAGKILNSEIIIVYNEVDGLSDLKEMGVITKKII